VVIFHLSLGSADSNALGVGVGCVGVVGCGIGPCRQVLSLFAAVVGKAGDLITAQV
jgi:hypothetical protein